MKCASNVCMHVDMTAEVLVYDRCCTLLKVNRRRRHRKMIPMVRYPAMMLKVKRMVVSCQICRIAK